MAKPSIVEIVLVIDTSDSMRPCIDGLRTHLASLLKPMQGYGMKVRFGLVALSASADRGRVSYWPRTLAPNYEDLYGNANPEAFFTEDTHKITQKLNSLDVSGDEETLIALDFALDHPFGPVATTKRVVAVFTDEPLENGASGDRWLSKIPELIDKIHARRIKLFMAAPYSQAVQSLSEADGSEIEDVGGAAGLASVDFSRLLDQMGKSISLMSAQAAEARYTPALFNQNKWSPGSSRWNSQDRTR